MPALIFPDFGEENPLWKSKRLMLQKTQFAAINTSCYLPKCKYVLPARGIFQSRTFRDIRLPFAGQFYECRACLKNWHEYPATFHAAKLWRIINTLYINKYRQSRTEATTPRKYSSSMKKKAFICPRNRFEASLIYEFTEAKNQRFEFVLSCCRTVVNKCCRK